MLIDKLAAAYRKHGFEVINGESSPTHPFEPVRGIDRICIAAGDGTVRHILSRLLREQENPPVDIYPAGTINLIARERGAPKDVVAFVEAALAASQRQLFPVAIGGSHFMGCASIGPDARAVARVSLSLKRRFGRIAYVIALVKTLFNWERPRITLTMDDGVIHCEAVYVANGRYFAGPWTLAPDARLGDQKFHVVTLATARRRDFVAFMIGVMLGRLHRLANVQSFTSTNIAVQSDIPQLVQADGDIIGALPTEIRISERAVPA